jgi:hypothetical protein
LSDLVNQLVVCFEKLISLKKTPVLVVDGIDKFKKSTKVEKVTIFLFVVSSTDKILKKLSIKLKYSKTLLF